MWTRKSGPAGRRLGLVAGFGHFAEVRIPPESLAELIDDAKQDMDPKRRMQTLIKAMKHHHDNIYHIPIHLQVIPWASRPNVEVTHRADNWLQVTWVKVK